MKKYFKLFLVAIKGETSDYTSGSINKALFLLAIPMIIEMIMESLFAVADMFFVAMLPNEEINISAVGLTESVMFLIVSIALGLSMPTTAIVARRIGEKNPEAASSAAVQAIIVSLVIAALIGIFGVFFAEELLAILGGSEELIKEGSIYTKIILGFNVILMLLFVNNSIFRGAGNASIAMRTLWIANGLNLILDPCLILGLGPFPALGLKGAAIATCIGRSIGVLYQFYYLSNGKSTIKIYWRRAKVKMSTILQILRMSIGGAGQHIIATFSFIFLAVLLNDFGQDVYAGYTIAFRVIMFTLLPSWGLAMAAATLVGQNLGAKKADRAEKSVWKAAYLNMGFLVVISILFLFIAKPVILLFSEDPIILKNGIYTIRIVCAGYIFYAFEMVIGQAFNGAGDTVTPTKINFVSFWLIMIPTAYLLSKHTALGPNGVYLSIAIASSIAALIAIYLFRKGHWKQTEV